MTTVTAAPPGAFALDELRDLLDRHDGDDLADLLDEVTSIVRRARAAVRRAVKAEQRDEPKPATPKTSPQPAAPTPGAGSVPAPAPGTPKPSLPTSMPTGVPAAKPSPAAAPRPSGVTAPVGVPARPKPQVPAPVAPALVVSQSRSWSWWALAPWVPLLILGVAVLVAVALGPGVEAAAVLLPALMSRPAGIDRPRGGARSVRPPGS